MYMYCLCKLLISTLHRNKWQWTKLYTTRSHLRRLMCEIQISWVEHVFFLLNFLAFIQNKKRRWWNVVSRKWKWFSVEVFVVSVFWDVFSVCPSVGFDPPRFLARVRFLWDFWLSWVLSWMAPPENFRTTLSFHSHQMDLFWYHWVPLGRIQNLRP